jgi:hypothetical protein
MKALISFDFFGTQISKAKKCRNAIQREYHQEM